MIIIQEDGVIRYRRNLLELFITIAIVCFVIGFFFGYAGIYLLITSEWRENRSFEIFMGTAFTLVAFMANMIGIPMLWTCRLDRATFYPDRVEVLGLYRLISIPFNSIISADAFNENVYIRYINDNGKHRNCSVSETLFAHSHDFLDFAYNLRCRVMKKAPPIS